MVQQADTPTQAQAQTRMQADAQGQGAGQAEELAALRWRFVGPYRGGRVMAVAGHPTERRRFYMGTSSSGVWRTDNSGAAWRCVSDGFFRRGSVGSLAIAESDPNVIYVGMGECGLRSNVTHGDGVYKSEDAGATWRHMGLAETQNIARVRVHPRDSSLVYAAAFGHRFGPNPERGVFRSRDAGETWELVLHVDEGTGAIDLAIDPQNPRVLYAAFWEAQVFPWTHHTRGPGSGLWKSIDGGTTWAPLHDNPGFPGGVRGRIGVTVSPLRPSRVWVTVDAEEGGIYRSDDGGATWAWLSDDRNFLVRPWYFGTVVADPADADALYVVNRKLWRSADGGRTYRQVNVPYVDEMDLWVDPREPRRMILGNDGGAAVSFDGGDTWSSLVNQPTAELYRVAADTHFPYRVYGSQQDNSTLAMPSRSDKGPISEMEWYDVGGGESGFIAVRPDDPNVVYSSDLPGLGVTRYDHRTHQIREIGPWGEPGGDAEGGLRHRFNWSVPVVLSPHDPGCLYVAGNRVFRSRDEGASWEAISPDLTTDDQEKVRRPKPGSHAGGENEGNHYCTVASFAESPLAPGLLWAGSDDGLVHVSQDDGASWADVTPPGTPAWSTFHVEPSAHAAGAAYAAATAHGTDDFRPYLWKTADFGASWEAIAAGIPGDEFVRVVRADPAQRGVLYAGTEAGVHVSTDDGGSWRSLRLNLPVVAVHDLIVKEADLVVGTHGRGLWILDDVTPLRERAAGGLARPVHLFAPSPLTRVTRQVYQLDSLVALYYGWAAENPPSGVVIYYRLAGAAGRVTVSLLDADGVVVNTFDSRREPRRPRPIGPLAYQLRYGAATLTGAVPGDEEPGIRWGALTLDRGADPLRLPITAGLHRVGLDITYGGARRLPGVPPRGITAPIAPPGEYVVRLTVDGERHERPVEIRADPRLATTAEEYRAQHALMIRLRDTVTEIHEAVIALRGVREQLRVRLPLMRSRGEWPAAVAAAEGVLAAFDEIEEALVQPGLHERSGELDSIHFPLRVNGKLEALGYHVARSDDPPTAQSYALYDDLAGRAAVHLARYREVVGRDVAELNRLMAGTAVPGVILTGEGA